jgi:glyoxylase-like metal-dependent hydrolase (beta-lactamase superfamily II)
MRRSRSRREFVVCLAGGVAGLSLAPRWTSRLAAQQRHPSITAARLADNLFHIAGAGGNVILLTAPDGALMVNGGLPERSAELMTVVAEQTAGARVTTLVNTDWHLEHTGSNETLGEAGATILAHEHTKQYLATEMHVDWQKKVYKPRPAKALPTRTFYNAGSLTVGKTRVEYGPLGQAHTDGDIFVHFPDANVLVAGDVLSVGKYPIADYRSGGWLGGLMTATKTLLDMANAETRVVPGVGPIQTKADLQAQFDMLSAVRERFVKMMRQGMGSEEMLAAGLTKEFDARWGNPELFMTTNYESMWLHVRELGGVV